MSGDVCGNPEVIELLESYLETARLHPFGYVAIAMVGHPNVAAIDYGGDTALEISSREAVGLLTGRIQASIDNWSLPPSDPDLDASYVAYNLANNPLGYDFVTWLVDAEMTRAREGAPGPLKVGFWLGQDGRLTATRRLWLENVFRPALDLIGAREDSVAIRGQHKEFFVTRDIVGAYRAGEPVPVFRPRKIPKIDAVTITLREAKHHPNRNSNVAAWMKFAAILRGQGERVIFVRDTAHAREPLEDFETCLPASVDLAVRAALYESSKANLFSSNGPFMLVLFGARPYLCFTPVKDNWRGVGGREFWSKNMAVNPGDQFPWSAPDQRIVWQADTFENIMSAWEGLELSRTTPIRSTLPWQGASSASPP